MKVQSSFGIIYRIIYSSFGIIIYIISTGDLIYTCCMLLALMLYTYLLYQIATETFFSSSLE